MPLYETTCIVRQDLSKQDVSALADRYTELLESKGGRVVKREYWGLRNLAYRVKKYRKGHYIMLGIEAPFEAIQEMQRLMTLNEEIIRSLVLRVDTISEEPSLIMQELDDESGSNAA